MPNGGVPIHMLLTPSKGEHVVYCFGSKLRIVDKKAWEEAGADAPPLLELTNDEARALSRFLRYWLVDNSDDWRAGGFGVNAAYDF